MSRTSVRRSARFLAVSVCLAAIVVLGGCVENAKTIREAQAQFSRAATVENRSLLGAEQAVQASTAAATDYRMAATTMHKLIADKGGALKKDNLLCTAMIIEALSWWRLGDSDAAMKIVNNSQGCTDSTVPPGSQPARDMALFQALPGLIRIDQANQKLGNPTPEASSFDQIMALLAEANTILQTARNQVGTGHPLQLYLIQSQLAIVRNWQSAMYKKNLSGQRLMCEITNARQQCIRLTAELACASLGMPEVQDKQQIVQWVKYWWFAEGCQPPSNDPKVLSNLPDNITQEACAQLNVQGGFPDNCSTQ